MFAAGDVAVTHNPITGEPVVTGLWTNAVEMGRCAGRTMAGSRTAYGGTFGILNATQIGALPFVSMGLVHTAAGGYDDPRLVVARAVSQGGLQPGRLAARRGDLHRQHRARRAVPLIIRENQQYVSTKYSNIKSTYC